MRALILLSLLTVSWARPTTVVSFSPVGDTPGIAPGFAYAFSAPAPTVDGSLTPSASSSPIGSTQYHSQDTLGQYLFGYVDDESTQHHETRTADGSVRGSFSYVDDDGLLQTTHYTADNNGYRVEAPNLQVEDTPEVKAARAAHLKAVKKIKSARPKRDDFESSEDSSEDNFLVRLPSAIPSGPVDSPVTLKLAQSQPPSPVEFHVVEAKPTSNQWSLQPLVQQPANTRLKFDFDDDHFAVHQAVPSTRLEVAGPISLRTADQQSAAQSASSLLVKVDLDDFSKLNIDDDLNLLTYSVPDVSLSGPVRIRTAESFPIGSSVAFKTESEAEKTVPVSHLSYAGPVTFQTSEQKPIVTSVDASVYKIDDSDDVFIHSIPSVVAQQTHPLPSLNFNTEDKTVLVQQTPVQQTLDTSSAIVVESVNVPRQRTVAAVLTPAKEILQFHAQDNQGKYEYGYSGGPSSKHEVRGDDGITRGAYSYIDGHGVVQTVSYTADKLNGFRVLATNLPEGPA